MMGDIKVMAQINEREREIEELKRGLTLIEDFGSRFVQYNTKYLGCSFNDEYIIKGKSTNNSSSLNEFCYGYDGEHHQLHLLHIYQMNCGIKYASIEISMCVYAFWEILN